MRVAYILPGSKNGNVTVTILAGDLTSSVHYRELKFFCQTDHLASFVAMNKYGGYRLLDICLGMMQDFFQLNVFVPDRPTDNVCMIHGGILYLGTLQVRVT